MSAAGGSGGGGGCGARGRLGDEAMRGLADGARSAEDRGCRRFCRFSLDIINNDGPRTTRQVKSEVR